MAFRTDLCVLECADRMSRLLSTTGILIDRIRINELTREVHAGRALWIKRRTAGARPIIHAANGFFRLVGNPVVVLGGVDEWRNWEIDCFRRLHGESFAIFAQGAKAICAEEVPGLSLSQHLKAGTLAPPMLAAAACELRRAHQCPCEAFGGPWSHGDPHAGNFIYDAAQDRARLIDFEVRHRPGLAAEERHADDLLVLLQDLVGRVPRAAWLPLARAFLEAYARPEILACLRPRLVGPRGLARLWWAVRTTYLTSGELSARIAELRAWVDGRLSD